MNICSVCGEANPVDQTICSVCQNNLEHDSNDVEEMRSFLHDRYRLVSVLGSGGFGSVYKAYDTLNGDAVVAIKQIDLFSLTPQQIIDATDTFYREIKLLSTIQHPRLPHIHDSFSDAEHWYLVMDLMDGETLENILKQQENKGLLPAHTLPISDVVSIGIQLCDILDYLHHVRPPIIYRDLKPSNVLLDRHGLVYLVDFGTARFFRYGQSKDTIPFGSPGYAAPEQYGRAQTDARSDIYSLGVLLHEMLSGKDPSERPFHFEPLTRIDLADHPQLPELITTMTELDADKRPQNMMQVKRHLQEIRDRQTQGITPQQRPTKPNPPPQSAPHTYKPVQGSTIQSVLQQIQMPTPDFFFSWKVRRRILLATGIAATLSLTFGVTEIATMMNSMKNQKTATASVVPAPVGNVDAFTLTSISLVSCSPDQQYIAVAGINVQGYSLQVWDLNSHSDRYLYDAYLESATVQQIIWSPDSDEFGVNLNQGQLLVVKTVPGGAFGFLLDQANGNSTQWSSDGQNIFAFDQNNHFHVITDTEAGPDQVVATYHPIEARDTLLTTWSPDGNQCAVANLSQNVIQVVDLTHHATVLHQIAVPLKNTSTINWSPDGKTIAFGEGPLLRFWKPGDTGIRSSITPTSAPDAGGNITAIAWSPDSAYVAYNTMQNIVHVYQTSTGKMVQLPEPQKFVDTGGLSWSQDSQTLYWITFHDAPHIQQWNIAH